MSQNVSHPTRHDDLLIPVLGETVAATRFEAQGTDPPNPVILNYDPYHKDDFMSFSNRYTDILYWTHHGYDVVIADMVGSGASTGGAKGMFTPDEGKEAAAIVEWLADQDWTTGSVGMFGMSYSGITCLKAAAERPDGLKTIVPTFAPATYSGFYDGGLVFGYWLMSWVAWMQTWQALPPSRIDSEGRWVDVWKERLDDLRHSTPWFFQGLEHVSKDDYWQARDVDTDRIEIPTFAIGGWRDPYHRDMIRAINQLDAPKRMLLGPWRHERPHLGRETAIDERRQIVEWFDRFLKGEDNDAADRPTFEYWTEYWDDGKLTDGVWQGTDRWPDVHTTDPETLTFAITPSGLVDAEEYDSGIVDKQYEFDQTVGLDSMDTHTPESRELDDPLDTSADDARSICFDSEHLSEPIEWSGSSEAVIRICPTITDPMLAVRIIDVGPHGAARLISTGRRRVKYRDGPTDESEVVPGKEYTLKIPLTPKSHVFDEGHRIRVALSGAFFPMVLPPTEQGEFSVLSSPAEPSLIRFPGRHHPGGFEANSDIVMNPPDDSYPIESPFQIDSNTTMSTSREHLSDTGSFEIKTSQRFSTPFANEMVRDDRYEAKVQARDPGSAAVHHESEAKLIYDTETVKVKTEARGSVDTAQMQTIVTIDGKTVFDERWTR